MKSETVQKKILRTTAIEPKGKKILRTTAIEPKGKKSCGQPQSNQRKKNCGQPQSNQKKEHICNPLEENKQPQKKNNTADNRHRNLWILSLFTQKNKNARKNLLFLKTLTRYTKK